MDEGRTVAIKELLLNILLKWRLIILSMIVFAILLGTYAAVNSYKKAETIKNQEKNADYSQYETGLMDNEIAEVNNAVEDYLTYYKTYSNYKTYNTNSIKMQLDANKVPTLKTVYKISGNINVKNICDSYIEMIPSDDICQQIQKNLDANSEVSYIKELISIYDSLEDTATMGGQEISTVLKEDEQNVEDNSLLMIVNIIADNQENCEMMGEIIQNEIENMSPEIKKQLGDFTIQKIGENYSEEANKQLLKTQQESLTEMNNVNVLMNNVDASLSEAQKLLFSAMLNDTTKKLENEENGKNEEIIEENTQEIQIIHVKYIAFGAIIGIFLGCFYAMCKFLLNRHLVSNCFISEDVGSLVLEEFPSKKKKKIGGFIDRWITSFFKDEKIASEREKMKMLCGNINIALQKNPMSKLYITGTVESPEKNQIIEELKSNFQNKNVILETGDSILKNIDSLEKFVETEGVIFIEQIGKSLVQDIYEETECCKKYDVTNLGFILIN